MMYIKKTLTIILMLFLLTQTFFLSDLFQPVAYAAGSNYYVKPSGNDTKGNGTSAKPWKTLAYACKKVAANKGHTIRLLAGTFAETEIVEVPAGVNIVGAGTTKTIIKSSAYKKYSLNPAIRLKGTMKYDKSGVIYQNGNQTISGFAVDGSSKKLYTGIDMSKRNNVTIKDLYIKDTSYCGLSATGSNNFKAYNLNFKNCAWGNSSYNTGCLHINDLTNSSIYNITINENIGYGIKQFGGLFQLLDRVKIYNCVINVPAKSSWNNYMAPAISIELFYNMKDCEVYNNSVNNSVSIVGKSKNTGKTCLKVHHNNVIPLGYAFESSSNDIEIYNNYIEGGPYPFACWSPTARKNIRIHHNVVNNYYREMLRFAGGCEDLKIYNNTCYIGGNTANGIVMYGGSSKNIYIKNNVFFNGGKSTFSDLLVSNGNVITGVQVTNNCLFNIRPGTVSGTYKDNITMDPKFTKSGKFPAPYFIPLDGSPVIDAGVNVGLPFVGKAPDMGAYEYGDTKTVIGFK